jgi:putative FmdB family regulatory protein
MPTYEYACTKCGYHFEQFQSMKDEPLKKCPKCKKPALKRLVGAGAGLIFKGTGFYITDYKKASAPPVGESGGDGKPSGGGDKPAALPATPAATPATPKPPAPEKKPVASKSSAKKSSAKR